MQSMDNETFKLHPPGDALVWIDAFRTRCRAGKRKDVPAVMAADTLFLNSCHHVVAAGTLFLNSCQHVVANFWARVLCSLTAEDACFRMTITLGVVLIRSLVFHVCFPECSRNGSGMRPYLWVQEKFV